MTETLTWNWAFPGGGWGLAGAVVAALLFVWASYARTHRLLSPRWRWTLTALRSALVVTLLICLAQPQMVLTQSYKRNLHKPEAVLVDTSGSMLRSDARGQTRLEIAQNALKRVLDAKAETKLFTFSEKIEPLSGPEALAGFTDKNRETHLLAALRSTLNQAPPGGWGGVMVFTDGADSTMDDIDSTGRLFQDRQTPLLLAATQTNLHQPDFIQLARVDIPPVNVVNTQYPLSVFVQSQSPNLEQVTIQVLQNNVSVAEQGMTITPGTHSQKATFTFLQNEPGTQDYKLQLLMDGQPRPADSLYACTVITDRPEIPVLYYAGSLSVEYRYVRAAFEDDPSIKIESSLHISASALRHQVIEGETARMHAENFPKSIEELKQFKVIVLADLVPPQLDDQQTAALLEYVKEGGGLIFLVSNTTVASDFSGSELEQLLPVVFEPSPEAGSTGSSAYLANRLHDQLSQVGDAGDNNPDDPNAITTTVAQLSRMRLTSDGLAILGQLGDKTSENTPLFREYAAVQRAKPGAIVAAEHSTDLNSFGRRPLLAMQHFGEGRSAVLATDSIWRWQLSLPSTSQAYKKLWQQMLFWIANREGDIPQVQLSRQVARPGDLVTVTLQLPHPVADLSSGSQAQPVTVSAYSPDNTMPPQTVPLVPGSEPGTYTGKVTAGAGPWMRLVAKETDGPAGMAILNIHNTTLSVEDEHLAPNLDLLHQLAQASGGQVIDAATIGNLPALAVQSEDVIAEKKVTEIWNNSFVFLLVLGLFCVELILRRWLKLL